MINCLDFGTLKLLQLQPDISDKLYYYHAPFVLHPLGGRWVGGEEASFIRLHKHSQIIEYLCTHCELMFCRPSFVNGRQDILIPVDVLSSIKDPDKHPAGRFRRPAVRLSVCLRTRRSHCHCLTCGG